MGIIEFNSEIPARAAGRSSAYGYLRKFRRSFFIYGRETNEPLLHQQYNSCIGEEAQMKVSQPQMLDKTEIFDYPQAELRPAARAGIPELFSASCAPPARTFHMLL